MDKPPRPPKVASPGEHTRITPRRDGSYWISPTDGHTSCSIGILGALLVNGELAGPLRCNSPLTIHSGMAGLVSFKNFPGEVVSLSLTSEGDLVSLEGMPKILRSISLIATGIRDLSGLPQTADGGLPYHKVTLGGDEATNMTWIQNAKTQFMELYLHGDSPRSLIPLIKATGVQRLSIDGNDADELITRGGADICMRYHDMYKSAPSKALLGFQSAMIKADLGAWAK